MISLFFCWRNRWNLRSAWSLIVVRFARFEKFLWKKIVNVICDSDEAIVNSTSSRLLQIDFSVAMMSWSIFIAYERSWKKIMFAVLLVWIRLIDELEWMLEEAEKSTRKLIITKDERTLSVKVVWCHNFASNVQWVLCAFDRCLILVFSSQLYFILRIE